MKLVSGLLAALVIPFMLLNLLGGVVGGIWLIFIGQWHIFFLGIAIAAFGSFAASLLLAPGLGAMALGLMALERDRNLIGWLMMSLNGLWTGLIILVWEVSMFVTFGHRVTSSDAIPVWLWAYGAATGVWSYMASKEQQSDGGSAAPLQAFAAQIAFLVLSVCTIGFGWSIRDSLIVVAVPLFLPLVGGIVAVGIAFARRRAQQKRSPYDMV